MIRAARRWTLEEAHQQQSRLAALRSGVPLEQLSRPPSELQRQVAQAYAIEKVRSEREKFTSKIIQQMELAGVRKLFITEHQFAKQYLFADKPLQKRPGRQWKLDFYCHRYALAIELHGGIHTFGRHNTGSGFAGDREKMNAAIEVGITVLEFTKEPILNGNAMCQVLRILAQRGWKKGA